LRPLASIDDVILYLRQNGAVFAEDESEDELLAWANGKRLEQGLPPFALLPTLATKAKRQANPERWRCLVLPLVAKGRNGHGALLLCRQNDASLANGETWFRTKITRSP
jgi:hypothetical protein